MIKKIKCPYCLERQDVNVMVECGKCKKKYKLAVKEYGMYSHLDEHFEDLE